MSQSIRVDADRSLKKIEQPAEQSDKTKPKGKCVCDCGDCPCAGKRQAGSSHEHREPQAKASNDNP